MLVEVEASTGIGFQPDMVWVKVKNSTALNHTMFDSVRGAGSNKELTPNGSWSRRWC
jgi:hypothetical protein